MKSKSKELRSMNDEQLGDALKDAYKKLFWVKFRATTEKVESAAERKELRRSIARIKTLQRERELAIKR